MIRQLPRFQIGSVMRYWGLGLQHRNVGSTRLSPSQTPGWELCRGGGTEQKVGCL